MRTYSVGENFQSPKDLKKVFLTEAFSNRKWSWGEFLHAVQQVSAFLKENVDSVAEKRIAFDATNRIEPIVLYFACMFAGFTAVPIDPTRSDRKKFLKWIQPALYVSNQNVEEIHSISFKKLFSFQRKYIDESFYGSFFKDHIVDLFSTSGTTGSPKAIQMPLESRLNSIQTHCKILRLNESDIHYCVLPLAHTASWAYHIWPAFLTGASVVLEDRFHASVFWNRVQEEKATVIQLVPTIVEILLRRNELNGADVRGIKVMGCGSSILFKRTYVSFLQKFGIALHNFYGLSEVGSTHIATPDNLPGEHKNVTAVGVPVHGVECGIFSEDGVEQKCGEVGEIRIRGNSLFEDYLFAENESNCFDLSGFFKTGDLGLCDSSGKYYVIDRMKDLIIRGGVNVVPAYVESLLMNTGYFSDVCVFGMPDSIYGEEVYAVAILVDEKSKPKLDQIDAKWRPRNVYYTKQIPMGFSGKKLRRILKDQYIQKDFYGK